MPGFCASACASYLPRDARAVNLLTADAVAPVVASAERVCFWNSNLEVSVASIGILKTPALPPSPQSPADQAPRSAPSDSPPSDDDPTQTMTAQLTAQAAS